MRQNHRYQLARQFDREAKAAIDAIQAREQAERRAAYVAEAPARERRDRALLAVWDILKPGDTFKPGNNVITIKRKNRWSVTCTSGISWSITEVVGLTQTRVEELRKA